MSEPGAGRDEEDFGVQLEWPADATGDPFDLPGRPAVDAMPDEDDAPPAPAVEDAAAWRPAPAPEVTRAPPLRLDQPSLAPIVASLPAGAEGLGPLLAAVAARVDALSAVTVTFRNLMSDHVAQQGHRLESALREQAIEADEHRRRQDEALGQLRDELQGVAAEVRALAAAVQAAPSGADAGGLQATLDELLDEVRSLRRRTPIRPRAGSLDPDQVQAMADAVAEALKAGSARPAPTRRPRKSG